MSGVFGFTGAPDHAVANGMAHALAGHRDRNTAIESTRSATLGTVTLHRQGSVFGDERVTVAIFSTHRYPLPSASPAAASASTAEIVAQAYCARGQSVIETLTGGFAVAIADHDDGSVLLAVDKMGICPLAWTVQAGEMLFGSSIDAVVAHPACRADLEPQAIYDYLFFHVVPGPRTIYRGVSRILPGHALLFRAGVPQLYRYFTPSFDETLRRPLADLSREFNEILARAVARATGDGPTGTFLSGGTDSSTVTGILSRASDDRIQAFSIGFSVDEYNEMSYARIAARHFATDHHEYFVTPRDVADAIPLIANALDQPFGNASVVPAYVCARRAREHGMTRMLAGDGGDELFGGNSRYATQQVLSWYEHVPASLRRFVLEPVAAHLGVGRRILPVRKLFRYVEQAKVPMPDRTEEYNLLKRLGPGNVVSEALLGDVDQQAPLAFLRQIYGETSASSLINRMLALDFRITLFDSDLPKVNAACDIADIEVAYPLLDDELVAFSLRLDPALKLRGTRLRYFFKTALRDFLPPEILTKQKHGFGLPFGVWLQSDARLKSIAAESLYALRDRGLINPGLVNALLGKQIDQHAGYYGTMAWVLIMLDHWLRARESAKARARMVAA